MKEAYLEVTFRRGRAIAAYYYLPRRPGEKSTKTRRIEGGMLIDYNRDEKPIGIEITAPSQVTLAAFNRILEQLGQDPIGHADLAPLHAA
ncbi:MAG: DUF2283 domain-containing protein [Planctomycetes bacterium]|nr:DUF2283 domain-containing protein [Planctomycetota bacterium]